MKSKFAKTYIMGAVLIIALAFLTWPRFISHKQVAEESKKIFNFEIKDIDKIDLEYANTFDSAKADQRQVVQLKKVNDNWVEGTSHDYKVKKEDVVPLMEKAQALVTGDIISKNPTKQANLEVGNNKGTHVKMWQGANVVADFWLGKSGPDGGTYFRIDGSDLVYSTKEGIGFYFSRPEWIDKTIVKQEQDKISKIALNTPKQKIVLTKSVPVSDPAKPEEKKPAEWQVVEPQKFTADNDKVNNLLSSLSNLMASDIVFDKNISETGLDKSKFTVVAYLDGDSVSAEIVIGNKIAGQASAQDAETGGGPRDKYYLKLANNDQIFTIDSYLIDNVFGVDANSFKPAKQ